MKWREILMGAGISLAVTIVGGLIIYYLTTQPDSVKSERLVYSTGQVATFTGGAQDFALSTIVVSNTGGVAARHVTILIEVKYSNIKDFAVNAGPDARELSRTRTEKSLRLEFDNFLPKENVNINLLLSSAEKPTVEVRSDASFGSYQPFGVGDDKSSQSPWNRVAALLVPIAGLTQIALVIFLRRRYFSVQISTDQNNAGFLMLHSGMVEQAEKIFEQAVIRGKYHPILMSNYALAKALTGDPVSADKIFRASRFFGLVGRVGAISKFNEALSKLASNDRTTGLQLLESAINMSPKTIRKYCDWSVHLDAYREDSEFKAIVGK